MREILLPDFDAKAVCCCCVVAPKILTKLIALNAIEREMEGKSRKGRKEEREQIPKSFIHSLEQ